MKKSTTTTTVFFVILLLSIHVYVCSAEEQHVQFQENTYNSNSLIKIKSSISVMSQINDDYSITNSQIYPKQDSKFDKLVPVDNFVNKNLNFIEPEIIDPSKNQQNIEKQKQKQKQIPKQQINSNSKTAADNRNHDNLKIPELKNQQKNPTFKSHQLYQPSKIVHYPFETIKKKQTKTQDLQKHQNSGKQITNIVQPTQDIKNNDKTPNKQPQQINLVPIKTNPLNQHSSNPINNLKIQEYNEQFIKNQVRIQILRRERESNLMIFRLTTFGLVLLALSTVLCLKKQKKKPVRYSPIDLQEQNFMP